MKKTIFALVFTLLFALVSCAPAPENNAASDQNDEEDQPVKMIGESVYFDEAEISQIMNQAINLWNEADAFRGVFLTKIEYNEQAYKWVVQDLLQRIRGINATITDEDIESYIESMVQEEVTYLSFRVSFIANDEADKAFARDFLYIEYNLILDKVDGQWTIELAAAT